MTDSPDTNQPDWAQRLAFFFAIVLVAMGLANNLPNIPGLLALVNSVPGLENLPRLSKYSSEFFFPLVFTIIMIVVVLKSSFARKWRDQSPGKFAAGLALDIFMMVTTITMATVYLIEHEQVCLIDQITGERARLMAADAARAAEYREIFGTEPINDYPDCQDNIGSWVLPLLLVAISVYFLYVIQVWGFPIVAVAIVIASALRVPLFRRGVQRLHNSVMAISQCRIDKRPLTMPSRQAEIMFHVFARRSVCVGASRGILNPFESPKTWIFGRFRAPRVAVVAVGTHVAEGAVGAR